MSNMEQREVAIKALISYPREAEVSQTYLMTVDVETEVDKGEWNWPYAEEEYDLHCILDTEPLFMHEPVGKPAVILNRFGGTYGPATFLLTADNVEQAGVVYVHLLRNGLVVQTIQLNNIRLVKESQQKVRLISRPKTGTEADIPALSTPESRPKESFKNQNIQVVHRPIFDEKLYVERSDELAIAQAWRQSNRRVLTIAAPPAVGKSWFLARLYQLVRDEEGQPAFYIDLRDFLAKGPRGKREIYNEGIDQWFRVFLAELHELYDDIPQLSDSVEVASMLRILAGFISKQCKPNQLVYVFVDGGDEASNSALKIIERQILGPILSNLKWRLVIAMGRFQRLSTAVLRQTEQMLLLTPFTNDPSSNVYLGYMQLEKLLVYSNVPSPSLDEIISALPGYNWSHPGLNQFLFLEAVQNFHEQGTVSLKEGLLERGIRAITLLDEPELSEITDYLRTISELSDEWRLEEVAEILEIKRVSAWQTVNFLKDSFVITISDNRYKITDGVREFVRAAVDLPKQKTRLQVIVLLNQLIHGDKSSVQQTWSQTNQKLLAEIVSAREYSWLTGLIQLLYTSNLLLDSETSTQVEEVKKAWMVQFLDAFIAARYEILASPELYRPMFRQIPLEKIPDLSLRNQFIRLWMEVDQIPLQAWPQEIPPKANIIRESPLLQTRMHVVLSADPMPYDRAEDEETNLLAREGFWFEHPAYRSVANATQMQAVLGPVGCGRTALAKGLCYNESRWSRHFWFYRTVDSGAPTGITLRSDLAEQLLLYAIARPTLLVPLEENQRLLLAEVLIGSLSKKQVLARLERARASQPWLRQATTVEQRTVWQDVGNTELALLIRAVESTTVESPHSELLWAKMLLESFQALSFYGVRVALDCLPGAFKTITTLMPTLQEWQQSGLITTFFIPDSTRVNMPGISKVPLTWSQTQLEALFIHRLLRLAEFSLPPNALFSSDSVYNEFMAGAAATPATPRKLAQLWQNALANLGDEEAISQNAFRSALTMMHEQAQATEIGVQEYNLERLEALMDKNFNVEELRSLCLALSVDYGNLGARNKRDKIRELVLLMNRTGRLPDLVSKCQSERPFINWA
jgi:hypothetical protein